MGQGKSLIGKTSSECVIHESPLNKDKDEYAHLGTVSVKLSWLTANVRYTPEQQNDIIVTGKGGIFHGTSAAAPAVMKELAKAKLFPKEIPLLDSRAHQLLITYSNGWHAISSPEIFSRHSGTCIIIGDRVNPGKPYPIKLGDCFRLGSVGVVVSEVKTDKGVEQRLDTNRLQYLREEALAFEGDQDEAALAAEEDSDKKSRDEDGNTQRDTVAPFCYMCYETHDTPEDHLVAPCDCKGDTRYLHVQCLQKWYQSSVCGSRALVIRTTGNGAPACKICGAAYKTAFRSNGVKTSLLEVDHPGPYISLVVVTRHDTSPGLFNTKFRLNFGPGYNATEQQLHEDPAPSELTIGRSSVCNMVLDYRTVSTVHAKLSYRNGQFYVSDARSSNGTMVYLQGPLPLQNNQTVRLRMGRSTLAIQARRSFSASLKGTLQRAPNRVPCTASLNELQEVMALAPPYIPKSIRNVPDEGSPAPDGMRRALSRGNSHLSEGAVESTSVTAAANPGGISGSIAETSLDRGGSVALPSEGIDGALILGGDMRRSRPNSANTETRADKERGGVAVVQMLSDASDEKDSSSKLSSPNRSPRGDRERRKNDTPQQSPYKAEGAPSNTIAEGFRSLDSSGPCSPLDDVEEGPGVLSSPKARQGVWRDDKNEEENECGKGGLGSGGVVSSFSKAMVNDIMASATSDRR